MLLYLYNWKQQCREMKITTKSFIERSVKVHGYRYDYSKVNYINKNTKVTIICNDHGEFDTLPYSHYNGGLCSGCAKSSRAEKQRLSISIFNERSIKVHGDRYDYSEVNYVSSHSKVKIKCHDHGVFTQSPVSHHRGSGCPSCTKITTEGFIERSIKVHGDRYDYSNSVYIGVHSKLNILCYIHGLYSITPNEHYRGSGCKKCTKFTYDDGTLTNLCILESKCETYVKIGVTHNMSRRL